MNATAILQCRCGEVKGVVTDASRRTVNRVVCYCDDCQAFAHHLRRADLLDRQGGTDIVQVAPATLTVGQGRQQIAGVRLTPKGLYRWHSTCCNTPLGNTVSPAIPFVGIVAQAFEHGGQRADALFDKPVGAILGQHAIGNAPPGSTGMPIRIVARSILKVLGWRIRGRTWPHPFFKRTTRAPIYPITILTKEQRDALRRFCGPHTPLGPS
jgi:hypothetical protein